MFFWGLQRPHSAINPLGDVGLCNGPTVGLSADGNISLQRRKEKKRWNKWLLLNCREQLKIHRYITTSQHVHSNSVHLLTESIFHQTVSLWKLLETEASYWRHELHIASLTVSHDIPQHQMYSPLHLHCCQFKHNHINDNILWPLQVNLDMWQTVYCTNP